MTATSKPIILILTTHLGGGHFNLAQSLRGLLEPSYEVIIRDPQPPGTARFYAFTSRHLVGYLTGGYILTDHTLPAYLMHRVLLPSYLARISALLEQIQPRLIITTHALLSYATARANERRQERVPLVFQLTDLGQLHMTWFTKKHADAYLVPTREIFEQCLARGIDASRLHLTGRPLRRQFVEVALDRREEAIAALGFDPALFTIFLQGGAQGSTGLDRTIQHLLQAHPPMQIMLAVGNNNQLASRYAVAGRVHVLTFTEEIALYMAAADIIAGKAGASFIAESFALEKPFLATSYIPGQETPNLRFIEHHNLGWVRLDAAAQVALLTSVASDPALIAAKVESIRAYKTWNARANEKICAVISGVLAQGC